jgi:double zinc ribbon protein
MSSASSGKPGGSASDPLAPAPQAMTKCPKCATAVRVVARFCPRCHATLRFQCPSCGHEQRRGGTCEKCGVDFLKYVGAVVAAKQAEADAIHERLEQRSTLLKNLLWTPFTLGIPVLRTLFLGRDRGKK